MQKSDLIAATALANSTYVGDSWHADPNGRAAVVCAPGWARIVELGAPIRLLPPVFAERLADGWTFAYEPSTNYIGLNHPNGGKQSVVRIEYGAYDHEIGAAIAALFNSAALGTHGAGEGNG